jgi:hypothetical protein
VLADSLTIQCVINASDSGQRLVSQAADVLVHRTVEDVHLDRETQSLCVVLSGDLEVRTFPSGDAEHEQWMLRGPGGLPEVAGCEEGIYPVERDPQRRRV